MSQAASWIALMLACSILLVINSLGLATGSEQTGLSLAQLFGNEDPIVEKCLSTSQSVQGCVTEVITAFLSHRAQLIGSACCKALIQVDDNCWPKVFPFNPFFPPLLKDHCAKQNASRSPSPSPRPSSTT